ncbi:DoxX family protein [Lysobacter firmicutimachus]|uniref:DoxX family protein n=1 Tax=Lysobacter firmicutimachus TaxID=1792846 RepID=A0AAU8MZ05_9GAMM
MAIESDRIIKFTGQGDHWATVPGVRWIGLLLLCAAYLKGGLQKAFDFQGAVAELEYFQLWPANGLAVAVIILNLGAAMLILIGWLRWLGALVLAAFTLIATLVALRYWELPPGPMRQFATNSFFEHLGLIGAFILVAWHDLRERTQAPQTPHTLQNGQNSV